MSATSDGRNPQPNFSRNRNNRVPALSAGYHIWVSIIYYLILLKKVEILSIPFSIISIDVA